MKKAIAYLVFCLSALSATTSTGLAEDKGFRWDFKKKKCVNVSKERLPRNVVLNTMQATKTRPEYMGECTNLRGLDIRSMDLRTRGEVFKRPKKLKRPYRPSETYQPIDLSGSDLNGADLRGINLSSAFLGGVNFSRTRLNDAFMENAFLEAANFSYAEMRDIQLSGSKASFVKFEHAKLDVARLKRMELYKAQFKGADIDSVRFEESDLEKANFGEVASFENTQWCPAFYRWTVLPASMSEDQKKYINGSNCNLTH